MRTPGPIRAALMLCLLTCLAAPLSAQPPGTATGPGAITVAGTVLDQTGALLPGATLTLRNSAGESLATATADSQGAFRLRLPTPPPGTSLTLEAALPGFSTASLPVRIGNPALRIVLHVATQREDISVTGEDAPAQVALDESANQSANTVDRAALDRLPVFDQNYIATFSRFLSDDATGTGGVTLVVNGVESNGPGVSASAIKNVKINQNPYSALYSRPGRARVEITTEEGTPDFHGTANFLYRDAYFDARNAFASVRPSEQRTYFEGSLTGPLGRGKHNTFLLSLEHDNDNLQSTVFAQTPTGLFSASVPSPMRHNFVAMRAFHSYASGDRLWISYSYEHESDKNQGIGGTTLPEAATNFTSFEHEVNIGQTHIYSPTLVNQLRFLVGYNDEPTRSVLSAPGIAVSGAFTGGGAQADLRRTEGHFDGTDAATWTHGRHEVKFGIDVPDISRRAFDDYRNSAGTYSFASLADYAANRPFSYIVQRGQGHLTFLEITFAGFIEDTMRLSPRLSLSVGARYYWQNFYHNVPHDLAPRLSLAFAPSAQGKTILRTGAGMFYDRTGPRPISDLLHFNGVRLRRLIANNPSYPITEPELAGLPTGITRLDPRQHIPYTIQYSAGIERQLNPKSTLALTYTGSRGIGLFRSIDANAPLPSRPSARPDPALGQVREIQSQGYQKSNALEINFRGRPVHWFSGQAQYTLGKTNNNTSGINSFPADSYAPQLDWSRSDNDRRHKFDLLGTLSAGKLFDFGTAFSLYSGKPVNITTGNDDNGDGLPLDRPVGTPRNSLHGPGYLNVDLNLTHEFALTRGKEAPTLALSLNAFNAINHTNPVTYVGVAASPFFASAVSAQPPRRMQLNAEFKF